MQLSAVVAVTLAVSVAAGAASEPLLSEHDVRYYVGSIGARRVYMILDLGAGKPGEVKGWYSENEISYIIDTPESLTLEGRYSPDGSLDVEETYSETGISHVSLTGRFDGRLDNARDRIDGTWIELESGSEKARLPFHLVSFARLVTVRDGPMVDDRLEFQDRSLEITPFANAVFREHLEREKARARREGRKALVVYEPTFYSNRLIGASVRVVRPEGNKTEGVVVGYVRGQLSTLKFEDLFRRGAAWQRRVDRVVSKHFNWSRVCPLKVASFTVVGTGSIRVIGRCSSKPLDLPDDQVDVALKDVADLLDPDGPMAEIVKAAQKEGAGAKGAPQGSGTPAGGFRAGFDCAKASAPVEKLICSTERTATLDRELNGLFGSALKKNPAKAKELRARQKIWVAERDRKCAAAAQAECLVPLYEARIEELRK